MRFKEILNLNERGLRMGHSDMKNDLTVAFSEKFTIGFEFELEIDKFDLVSKDDNELFDEYTNWFYENSSYSEEVFFDNNYKRHFDNFIKDFSAEPKFGWVTPEDLEKCQDFIDELQEAYDLPETISNFTKLAILCHAENPFKFIYAPKSKEEVEDKIKTSSSTFIKSAFAIYKVKAKEVISLFNKSLEGNNLYYVSEKKIIPAAKSILDDVDFIDARDYFDYDEDIFNEDYADMQNEIMMEGYDDWLLNNNSKKEPTNYIYEKFREKFNYPITLHKNYHQGTKNNSVWYV